GLAFQVIDISLRRVAGDFKKKLSRQRISVGVQAVRRQADEQITGTNLLSSDDPAFVGDTHNEAGQIVFASGIEAWHFRGLTANQSATVMTAGFGNAFHDLLSHVRLEHACGQVVHEKQGHRPLHSNVVDAMVHQVASHRVVLLHHERDFKLGADAVHTRDQDWLAKFFAVDGEHASETADL